MENKMNTLHVVLHADEDEFEWTFPYESYLDLADAIKAADKQACYNNVKVAQMYIVTSNGRWLSI